MQEKAKKIVVDYFNKHVQYIMRWSREVNKMVFGKKKGRGGCK